MEKLIGEVISAWPTWLVLSIVVLFLATQLRHLIPLVGGIASLVGFFDRFFYNQERRDFVVGRNNFVGNLISRIETINQESNWSDLSYTNLEAEVEVDPVQEFEVRGFHRPLAILRVIWLVIRGVFRSAPHGKVEKNLVRAIMKSETKSFLLIGDPGSGKTVSLSNLFLTMARPLAKSASKGGTIPIYLNLKQFGVPPERVNAKEILNWVLEELKRGQNRTIERFVDMKFDAILNEGKFFFLFDSFDEIPRVLDAQEDEEVVGQYARALSDFIHSAYGCQGLVSSRPYRAPRIFVGRRMIIHPLSNRRIKSALRRYLTPNTPLSDRIWGKLVQQRSDLLEVARNPFYLNLLVNYAEDEQDLPEGQFNLFEHFIQKRVYSDESRLSGYCG